MLLDVLVSFFLSIRTLFSEKIMPHNVEEVSPPSLATEAVTSFASFPGAEHANTMMTRKRIDLGQLGVVVESRLTIPPNCSLVANQPVCSQLQQREHSRHEVLHTRQ